MKRARAESKEIRAAFQSVKTAATELTTNYFAGTEQEQKWTSTGALSQVRTPRCLFLFRRDRDFEHLYHVAASRADLAEALASLDLIPSVPLVTDLVGRPEDVAPVAEIYRRNGFEDHVELIRMMRAGGSAPDAEADVAADYAQPADAPAIAAFLDGQLDPYRDQMPDAEEIEAAIARRSILIDRRDGAARGLLYFEDTGRTSTIRYWYVDKGCSGCGVGGSLMRTYLREHSSTARFLLWVVAGNADAIAKYEHYGFRREKLIDQIMIRKRESTR